MKDWFLCSAIVLTSFVGLLGDTFIKTAGATAIPNYYLLGIGTGIYASTAFGWFYVLRHIDLTTLGVVYPLVQALALTALGVFYFKEVLTYKKIAGILVGFLAICLIGVK